MANKTAQTAAAIALIALSCPPAYAFSAVPGNDPPIDSDVVRNACDLPSDSGRGTSITGCLQDNHAELVTFTADEALLFDAGGQSSVEAQDGLYSRLSITRPGQTVRPSACHMSCAATAATFSPSQALCKRCR